MNSCNIQERLEIAEKLRMVHEKHLPDYRRRSRNSIVQLPEDEILENNFILNNISEAIIPLLPERTDITSVELKLWSRALSFYTLKEKLDGRSVVSYHRFVNKVDSKGQDFFIDDKNNDGSYKLNGKFTYVILPVSESEFEFRFSQGKHASIAGAVGVLAAGELEIEDGKIVSINDISGGYHHTDLTLKNKSASITREVLKKLGLEPVLFHCFKVEVSKDKSMSIETEDGFDSIGIKFEPENDREEDDDFEFHVVEDSIIITPPNMFFRGSLTPTSMSSMKYSPSSQFSSRTSSEMAIVEEIEDESDYNSDDMGFQYR